MNIFRLIKFFIGLRLTDPSIYLNKQHIHNFRMEARNDRKSVQYLTR